MRVSVGTVSCEKKPVFCSTGCDVEKPSLNKGLKITGE